MNEKQKETWIQGKETWKQQQNWNEGPQFDRSILLFVNSFFLCVQYANNPTTVICHFLYCVIHF